MAKHSNMYAVFLYYFAKFWGLAPFAWTSSRPCVGSAKELLYPSILALLCILEFFNTMVNRLSTDKAGLTTITNIGSNLSNQIGDLTGGLYLVTFTIKRRKIVQIINMSYKVDGMLSLLGVEQNYKKISKRWATLVGLSSAAIFIVVYGTCLTYWIPIGSITLSACYAYVIGPLDHFIHHHVELLFVIVMDFVRNRYEQLNDRLISVWPHEPALGVDLERHDFSRNREALIADARRHHIIPVYGGVSKPSEKLRIIAELSKILHEITDSVVEVASLPIMLNLTYYFVFSLTVIYYLFITAPTAYATSDYVTMAQLFGGGVWTGLMLCELLAVAAICSLTQKTANSAASIVHTIWHQRHSPEIKDEEQSCGDQIQMLSLQLLQRPLTISAFGFFSLDYSYLYKIFCAAVAYSIVMLQLDTSKFAPCNLTDVTLNVSCV